MKCFKTDRNKTTATTKIQETQENEVSGDSIDIGSENGTVAGARVGLGANGVDQRDSFIANGSGEKHNSNGSDTDGPIVDALSSRERSASRTYEEIHL